MFTIKAYGIFPGAAREDDLVAVVAYGWDDYRKIFGGTVNDYKDFLLERKDFIEGFTVDPVRIVEVPWDEDAYKNWRAKSVWPDEIDAHGAWALAVARDREKLRELKEKHPVLPAAPEEEEITAEVSYALIPYVAGSDTALRQVSRALPEEFLQEVLKALRGEFAGLSFEAFSPKRGEGVLIAVGNRFVTANRAEDLAEKFMDGVPKLAVGQEKDVLDRGILGVPRQMRIKEADGYPVFAVLLLPVVFVGANRDVDYAVDKLWEGPSLKPLEEAVRGFLAQFAPNMSVEGPIPVAPWYLVEEVVTGIMDQLEEEDEELEARPGRPNLQRIK